MLPNAFLATHALTSAPPTSCSAYSNVNSSGILQKQNAVLSPVHSFEVRTPPKRDTVVHVAPCLVEECDQADRPVRISSSLSASNGRPNDDSERAGAALDHVSTHFLETYPVKFPYVGALHSIPENRALTSNAYLVVWLFLNICITLYMKMVFHRLNFPYPLTVTVVHMCFTGAGVHFLHWCCGHCPQPLSRDARWSLAWFSFVFSLNVFLSNASLLAVSISFHQVARTVVPLITILITFLLFRERYPCAILPPVIFVIIGVAVTLWDDVSFKLSHFAIVFTGCFFASLKGILTQKTQVGTLGMNSLDLLGYLSPLAAVQLFCLALGFGEIGKLHRQTSFDWILLLHLTLVGCVAFALNYVSFKCATLQSPLTLNIAGNLKQVITSLLGLYLFGDTLTLRQGSGIVISAVAGYWYFVTMESAKRDRSGIQERRRCSSGTEKLASLSPKALPTPPSDIIVCNVL